MRNLTSSTTRRSLLKIPAVALGAQASAASSDLVRFGYTDLRVSRLCQGTAFRQLKRDGDDPGGQAVLRRCLDLGINFFDSSNAYGWGGAETALGRALAGRRDKAVICTKVSPHAAPGNSEQPTLSRESVFREVEGSLRRLQTDYIDLYLYHNPDNVTPAEVLADTMDRLVRAGKIRYWGVSNFSGKQVAELVQLGKRKGKTPIAGLEDYYNIIAGTRGDFMEQELFPQIRRGRLGLMAFSPIGEGRLAPERPLDRTKPWAPVAEAVDEVAKQLGATRPQICVAWVLTRPGVTCVLAGAERPEHVDDNLRGTQIKIPAGALRRLNEASARLRCVDTSG
ncbi:MAG: aldo/keto reductase [Acidobacteria bacterium]|nr:aldo/keto reductase [Acidobacteriota bacterium]